MKIINLILAAAVLAGSPCAYSQMSKEKMKERSEYTKMSRDQLNKKASKDARNEAKRLKKEGWQAAPGALPLEKQLDRSYIMMSEVDNNYMPKFLTAGKSNARCPLKPIDSIPFVPKYSNPLIPT